MLKNVKRLVKNGKRLSKNMKRLVKKVKRLLKNMKRFLKKVKRLAKNMKRLAKKVKRLVKFKERFLKNMKSFLIFGKNSFLFVRIRNKYNRHLVKNWFMGFLSVLVICQNSMYFQNVSNDCSHSENFSNSGQF
ncbi:MAG: hypothetical protein LBB56_02455 [Chitinispirillales bacterium]|nr:hypothetical protein [Chitinispirillales bacterium]